MAGRLYILAGANGSGKSTISKVLLPEESLVYVNPDDIARELNPADPPAAKIEAGKETLRRIDDYLARSKKNFVEHYMKAVDQWKLVYNGVSQSVLVASGDGSNVAVINADLYSNFKEGV